MKEQEKAQLLREHLSTLGKKGGDARAKKMTKKQRSAVAKKAARSRWSKRK